MSDISDPNQLEGDKSLALQYYEYKKNRFGGAIAVNFSISIISMVFVVGFSWVALVGVAVPLLCIIFSALDLLVLRFRIRRGFFGDNEAEAREILTFLSNRPTPPGGFPSFSPLERADHSAVAPAGKLQEV